MTKVVALGDTHDDAVGTETVMAAVSRWLEGADLILHTGDVASAELLDALEGFAPVVAVRSESDPVLPPRLEDGPRALTAGDLRIELHRTLPPGEAVAREDVDLVVHGATHVAAIRTVGRTLYVDPGSTTFAHAPSLAVVEAGADGARATLVMLKPAEPEGM